MDSIVEDLFLTTDGQKWQKNRFEIFQKIFLQKDFSAFYQEGPKSQSYTVFFY